MKFRFDHCYTEDVGHKFWRKFEKLGFTLYPYGVKHPGDAHCEFVKFGDHFLEFISFKSAKPRRQAGLSCATDEKLLKFYEQLKNKKSLPVAFEHRAYKWQKDPSGPGWNYLHFPSGPKALKYWLTEFEVKRKKRAQFTNRGRVAALEIEVTARDAVFFTKALGFKKLGAVVLDGGTELHFVRAKKTRFSKVVVAVPQVNSLQGKGLELAVWNGMPALCLRNPDRLMWDVFYVEA